MQTLIYFLIWGALIFFMMRFGCGAYVMGHGHGRGHRAPGPQDGGKAFPDEAKDPVCGMTVKTADAKSSVHNGLVYHFCSAVCRDKFEASPATYAQAFGTPTQAKEHHHGCC